MSTPGLYDFAGPNACYQGATLLRDIQWTQDNAAKTPMPISGYVPQMQVRTAHAVEAVALDCTEYLSVTDAETGQMALNVPAAVTATLTPGRYVYDLILVGVAGIVALLRGTFDVQPRVTVAVES